MNQPAILYQEPAPKTPPQRGPSGRRSLRLTERDYAILLDLLRLRFATTPQLCALHFPGTGGRVGRLKACQRRLKLLTGAGLIKALKIPLLVGTHPHVYLLTPRGLARLSAELDIDPADVSLTKRALDDYRVPEKGFDNYEHLQHILCCTDFYLALTHACQQARLEVREYLHEYELRSQNFIGKVDIPHPLTGKTAPYTLVPDAFFHLVRGGEELRCFLELDRSTIVVAPTHWERRSMTKKFLGYQAFFSSPAYQARFPGPCLVLTVAKTPERLASLAAAAGAALGADERFWFTTYDRATDPHQVLTTPIWQIAASEGGDGQRRHYSLLPG